MGTNVLLTDENEARAFASLASVFYVSLNGGDTAYRVSARTEQDAWQTGRDVLSEDEAAHVDRGGEPMTADDFAALARERVRVFTPEGWTAWVIADEARRRLEPGDHIVCACGLLHERDYCATAAGHGAAR